MESTGASAGACAGTETRGVAALAKGLIEHHRARCRDVELADPSGHGNPQQVVAGAPDQIVQARAFASQHDHTVAGQVELIVVGCSSLVETDDPKVLPLELFEGTDKVDDAGNAQVLSRAGAGLHGHRAEGR